ncbi:MAG: hypothetical protein Q4E41_02850 [Bacteroidales bacterium]|nr:hypothetical protein [Bacteroidales bacterium]
MKRQHLTTLLTTAIVAMVFGIMKGTCPSETEHRDTMGQSVRHCIEASIDSSAIAKVPLLGSLMAEGGKILSDQAISTYLSDNYTVSDYWLWSVGRTNIDGEQVRTTFGMLGHVWTCNEDRLQTAINAAIKKYIIDKASTAAAAAISILM